jgi:NADH-quinone oxidoreductase subunit I
MSAAHHDDSSSTRSHPDEHEGPKVLATTTSSKGKVRNTIQVVRPEPQDASFLAASAKGIGITLKHFAKNLFLPLRKLDSRRKAGAPPDEKWKNEIETVQYPEEKVKYPERFRGLHRLMLRDDGAVRCVACMCCPTVCPAHCITIIPAETDNKGIEKKPAVFEIDELRCVVCGLCVEACPCDAIRMDTGDHAKPVEDRADAVETLGSMLARGIKSTAKQGGEGPNWRATAQSTAPDDGEVNR